MTLDWKIGFRRAGVTLTMRARYDDVEDDDRVRLPRLLMLHSMLPPLALPLDG